MAASVAARSAITASIAPGSRRPSAFISWPRRATRRTASSPESMPPKDAAAKSPRLWPSSACGSRPSDTSHSPSAMQSAAIAGWHTSVRVRCACAAAAS